MDKWWIDSRTQAALERAVGLGDHITFTADQTRPLQLTRSQVRESAEQQPSLLLEALTGFFPCVHITSCQLASKHTATVMCARLS